jgi:hypothetical protein
VIILKYFLGENGLTVRTGQYPVAGFCEYGYDRSCSIKAGNFLYQKNSKISRKIMHHGFSELQRLKCTHIVRGTYI